MAELTITEKLQPSLLDRLTDENPSSKTERREDRVIDVRSLRQIIERDLSWLLNTTNNDDLIDPDLYPLAARSVLNFGVRDISGEFSNVDRAELIRKSIVRALEIYEPRIQKGSVLVEAREGDTKRETVINFDIRADMWAQPMPIELFLRSEVDVTTGELSLERQG